MQTLWPDIRFAFRMLRKSPGFATIALVTLVLGIGANTAIFSVVDAVFLRPLPYTNPSSLVWATEHFGSAPSAVIGPDFAAWRDLNHVFQQIEAFSGTSGANLTGVGEPARVSVRNVTTGLFSMLGIRPIAGRMFLASEGEKGHEHVALLNEELWRTRFGGDFRVMGETIRLDNAAYTVVGVMPASVRYPAADIWVPLATDSEAFSPHSPRWMIVTVIGRLRPGKDIVQAQSDLQVITQQMDKDYPPQATVFRSHERVEVILLHAFLVQNSTPLLMILMAATGFVLLIACVNVANLFLSRGVVRGKEIAVRAALGAGRFKLIQQLLTDVLLLIVIGDLLGALTGLWTTKALEQLIPSNLPSKIGLDPAILAFSGAIAALALVIFGATPAVVASRIDPNETLKGGVPRIGGGGTTTQRVHALMSAVEIALSLILLVGAVLLTKSFLRLTNLEPGFDPRNLLIATVERPLLTGSSAQQRIAFYEEALERLRNLPGVAEAALTERYPFGSPHNAFLSLRVQSAENFHLPQPISVTAISPGYFHLMRIRLVEGREFSETDGPNSQPVVIINESLARMLFETRDPIGQHIAFGMLAEPMREVVGVVADVKEDAVGRDSFPEIFAPFIQYPSVFMSFVLRTPASPENLAPGIREAVRSVDKDQPISQILTMGDLLSRVVAPRRFRTLLLGLFALLAVILAAVGVYGVIAYSCTQRTREFGLRVALGASRNEIITLVIRKGLTLAVIGVIVGLIGAFFVTRFLTSLLYGVKPIDPLTFAAAPIMLIGIALAASYIPARRASRVDPMVALRHE